MMHHTCLIGNFHSCDNQVKVPLQEIDNSKSNWRVPEGQHWARTAAGVVAVRADHGEWSDYLPSPEEAQTDNSPSVESVLPALHSTSIQQSLFQLILIVNLTKI